MNPQRPTTGVVEEVHRSVSTATLEWKIPNYPELELREMHQSPTVEYFNSTWWLAIAMTEDGIHYVCLVRRPLTPGIAEPVYYTIRCKTSDGVERGRIRRKRCPERTFYDNINPPWRIPPAAGVTLRYFLQTLDPPHTSGTYCDAQTQAEGAPMKDLCILSKDFKTLLLPGTGQDVLLKVGDVQFRAHKCILQARSPVFEAMFRNQMAESADGSVTIEDCDPDAFGQFLQFLYSGEVDITSIDVALGVYHAGDKYDIPRLKEISVAFMKSSFAATHVFDVASLAARHEEKELLQLAVVYFANHLEEVLVTEEWQRFQVANPARANEMYLKAAQYLRTSRAGPKNRKRRRTSS